MISFWKKFLPGYKTYIAAFVMLLAVILDKGFGVPVPGFEMGDNWMTMVMMAFGFAGLRAAK